VRGEKGKRTQETTRNDKKEREEERRERKSRLDSPAEGIERREDKLQERPNGVGADRAEEAVVSGGLRQHEDRGGDGEEVLGVVFGTVLQIGIKLFVVA
jgi:hypothetical protein